jgi:RNA polymerase sigma-70 factor (ECF subfamily)
VRRGDPAALEALFRAYATPLREFAYRLVQERDVAHELVQDVFLGIWAQRAVWRVRGPVSTYLFGAVRNRALNEMRRERAFRRLEVGADLERRSWLAERAPVDALVLGRELADAIRRALDGISARAREVFRLAREEELKYARIAERLGVSVPTVERDMAKAVDALRRELKAWRNPGGSGER